MKKIKLTLLLLFVSVFIVKSATVDTITTFSPSMNKWIKAVVIKPAEYGGDKKFPVVFVLHGYSGNYADWVNKAPAIKDCADRYNVLIVCPDGNFSSWYFDSPIDPTMKYESYIAKELPKWIEINYKTYGNKENRAITGLSMGGHGALYLAIKHQDVFSIAGSISGGVDLRPFPANWDIAKRLGDFAKFPERWNDNSVINMVDTLISNSLKMSIDCGSEDFFNSVNVSLHEKLLKNKIPHDYTSRPGGHTWEYWNNAIKYQVLFMSDNFSRKL